MNESKKLTNKEIIKLIEDNKNNIRLIEGKTIRAIIKKDNQTITIYNNNTVLYQGSNNISINKSQVFPQAGSDETGTGDTFGPIVVACAIVEEKDIDLLKKLNIKDSKEIKDEDILKIAPILMKKIKNVSIILHNEKLNKIIKEHNFNEIKAVLHNKVYMEMDKKYKLPKLCIVDEFCPEKNYYNYLKYIIKDNEIKRNLLFQTKAENQYISVAVASIIARYRLLLEFDKLNNKYQTTFTKGSSDFLVQKQIEMIIKKYGKEELNKIAKISFKNVQKAIND